MGEKRWEKGDLRKETGERRREKGVRRKETGEKRWEKGDRISVSKNLALII